MGPEISSSTGAGVWRTAPGAFPDSNAVLDKFQWPGVRKTGWFTKRVVLADVPWPPKTGTRVQKNGTTVPKTGNEGTKPERRYQKPGTRVQNAKTALLFPLEVDASF